ncbi:heparinase II/III family protein [Anaerotaenia torta]|uniref:heparinase II/III family protein n=1 Tax=Anaerotaenia torta TaxID=433293 RepID=UPI003D1F94F4
MFYEKAVPKELRIKGFEPYPAIGDRDGWEAVNAARKKELVALAEENLQHPYPPTPAVLYMDYSRTGNRIRFEDNYKTRRRYLNTYVLAECLEDRGRFLDAILDGIFFLCEESGWQLPAHNYYDGKPGVYPLPDTDRPVLDLFACETGAQLAMLYYLMKERLDRVSELICIRIEKELLHRIIRPFLNCHFGWMGGKGEVTNNWTIWCTQNVLLTVFLLASKPSRLKTGAPIAPSNAISWDSICRQVLEKAAKSIDYFLEGYGEDGCCDEGAVYYRHAGLCLFNSMEVLNRVTEREFDFYQAAKIRNIASYICNVHVEDIYYVNFADCSAVAGRCGAREFLFGKRIGYPGMMKLAALEYKAAGDKILSEELNLFYRVQSLFANDEMEAYPTEGAIEHKDIYYESAGVFLASDSRYFLAAKAGHNGDSHNHNDTGSFIVYKDGKPFLIDVGVETYSGKTFSPQRYEIWTMQSAYHNLPTINGVMQSGGRNYYATEVEAELKEDTASLSMDIAAAYPREADIESYRRKITLVKEGSITVEDRFRYREKPERGRCMLTLMTYEKPVIRRNIITVGDLGDIRVDGNASMEYEEIPITDPRLQQAWKHNIYRIKIYVRSDYITLTIQESALS